MPSFQSTVLIRAALAGVLTLSLGACATDEDWSTERDSRWTTSSDVDQRGNVRQRRMADLAGDPDHFFLMQAAHTNEAEIDLARIALQRASDPEVRDYAQMMIDHHTEANRDVMQIAQRKGIDLPTRPMQARRMHTTHFDRLSGSAFDREYVGMMIANHAKAVALFEFKADYATDRDIRNFAQQGLPMLREHLQQAKDLNRQLAGNSGSGSDSNSMYDR